MTGQIAQQTRLLDESNAVLKQICARMAYIEAAVERGARRGLEQRTQQQARRRARR